MEQSPGASDNHMVVGVLDIAGLARPVGKIISQLVVGLGDQLDSPSRRGGGRVGLDDFRIGPVAIGQGVIGVTPPDRQGDGVQGLNQAIPGVALSGAGGNPVAHVANPKGHADGGIAIGDGAGIDFEMAAAVQRGNRHDEVFATGAQAIERRGKMRLMVPIEGRHEKLETLSAVRAVTVFQAERRAKSGRQAFAAIAKIHKPEAAGRRGEHGLLNIAVEFQPSPGPEPPRQQDQQTGGREQAHKGEAPGMGGPGDEGPDHQQDCQAKGESPGS